VDRIVYLLCFTFRFQALALYFAEDEDDEEEPSSTLRKKMEEEKKQREHLLQLNQILAKQVMEKSKLVAGKEHSFYSEHTYHGLAHDNAMG